MSKSKWVLVATVFVGVVVSSLRRVLAVLSPVPTWARDLNCDGRVSIAEWYEAGIDHGWRSAVGGPSGCMEVFRFKDGLPDVLWCDQAPRCRRSEG